MPDPLFLPSPTANHNKPLACSLFPSPRLFVGPSAKGFSDSEAAMSPTSIRGIKPFSSSTGNPFFSDRHPAKKPPPEAEAGQHPWDNGGSEPVGLGIVDALCNDKDGANPSKQGRRMVLLGSQFRIQIPSIHPISLSPTGSVESPIEFGIKNKDSRLALLSPARPSPRVFTGSISASEMELSEDYTCVISHGPNPKTTHIFDNCIVESCADMSTASKESRHHSIDFLSFCHACKKNLGQGEDIFMYRGEKAFCSSECRYQEMLVDEGMDNCVP